MLTVLILIVYAIIGGYLPWLWSSGIPPSGMENLPEGEVSDPDYEIDGMKCV